MRQSTLVRRAANERGFTLVELLVALAAGLLISLAVVGLSRAATETFHEEIRASNTELSLRVATERLRFDLSRAAFMSSPNVRRDNRLTLPKGSVDIPAPGPLQNGLGVLAGIAYVQGGSNTGIVATYSGPSVNNLNPDSITLSGNFTTADEYIIQSVSDSIGAGAPGGKTLTLSRESPAISRLILNPDGTPKSDAAAQAALNEVFMPVPGQFMVRILDDTGFSQYLALYTLGGPPVQVVSGVPMVFLDPSTNVLTAAQTGGAGGITGFGVGRMTVNPVQTVRWSIRPLPATADLGVDPARFDLVRTWVDASGAEIPNGSERIAEYAVDLKFAFTIETGAGPMTSMAFGDPMNSQWAQPMNPPPAGANPQTRPEDIRSVRFRLAVRTALPDRNQNLPGPTAGYMYRYCLNPTGCAGTDQFARVRTITSEVMTKNITR